MMRAFAIGALGAVLAAGAAQGKVCKLEGLELVAKQRSDRPSPFAGERFRVVRQSSSFKTVPDNVGSLGKVTVGFIAVEVEGPKGRFFVDQAYIPHSAPYVSATSWASGQSATKVNWSKRDRRAERRLFDPDGTFDIYGGPLEGLLLEPTNCR